MTTGGGQRTLVFLLGALLGGGSFVAFLSSSDLEQFLSTSTNDVVVVTKSVETINGQQSADDIHSSSRFECVSLDEEIPVALNESGQTFVTGCPKAGGISLKTFTASCMDFPFMKEGWRNTVVQQEKMIPFLVEKLKPPKLVASHVYRSEDLVRLMSFAASNSLIIYVHRPEISRLASAISFLIRIRVCGEHFVRQAPKLMMKSKGVCYIDELIFIDRFIKGGMIEIGSSGFLVLACDMWEKVNEMEPNLMIVDYRQLDQLQEKFSSTFCPLTKPKHRNGSWDEKGKYIIRTESDGNVELSDWIESKKDMFEYWLEMPHGGCKGETRRLETALSRCPDHIVRVKGLSPYAI